MITLAAPAFLAAGALLALVPLALHMLARTPPERRPLPTARFLEVDRRTRLRLRRPTDLLLLALRMALLLLLGAAFARPAWMPDREGMARVVLLDAGAGMAGAWEEAVAVAADRVGENGVLVVFDTAARPFDDGAAALDSLRRAGPRSGPSSYLAALRGLRAAAVTLTADSAEAVLVTRPRWGAWSAAIPAAREGAWPGRIEIVAVGGAGAAQDSASGTAPAPPGSAIVIGPEDHALRRYIDAALAALGFEASDADRDEADLAIVLSAEALDSTRSSAAQVVALGASPRGGGGALAWEPEPAGGAGRPSGRGRLVLASGEALPGWRPLGGGPAGGARVVAVWEDGTPAAATGARGGKCIAYLSAEPVIPGAAADPRFPLLLNALAEACAPRSRVPAVADVLNALALDSGALAILGADLLPAAADLAGVAVDRGQALSRVLLAVALLVTLAEIVVAHGRERAA